MPPGPFLQQALLQVLTPIFEREFSPTPTPCPRPTTHTAGDQLLSYYFQVRWTFPIFPSAPQIDFDEPFCEANPEAQFRGLTQLGIPILTVREGFVMT